MDILFQTWDILFFVEDTGIGISEENKTIVFERFRQVESSLSRKVGGTGLGLSISKAIVELMDGSIWLESVPNKGSKFFFTIHYKPSGETSMELSLGQQATRHAIDDHIVILESDESHPAGQE